ncbi:MAG: molecular chaperone Hsp33, partial [Rhodospirillales bacterium]|nr:molecular chaperone Hsp33 [Rhodospirillales bacterium]
MTETVTQTPTFTDSVQHFQVEGPGLRGRMVRIGPALGQALDAHGYPDAVARLLGETVAVTVALASALKYDGVFTLQAIGDGAVQTLMADITSDGAFRCYARFDDDKLDEVLKNDADPSLPRLMGAGHLAFTVDQGADTERYQGITELTGSTLADCAHHYFRQSEQLQTAMVVMCDPDVRSAGAIMLQQLPEENERPVDLGEEVEESEEWRRAVILMSSLKSSELLDDTLPPSDLLFRLFHEDGVRLFDANHIRNQCRCSEQKVRGTLKSF